MLLGLAGLPILVSILQRHLQGPGYASYIAAAIITACSVVFSFVGHKNVSFRQKLLKEDPNISNDRSSN